MKSNPKRIAITVGVIWGLYILIVGWAAAAGWGNQTLISVISDIYVGFRASFVGGLIGALWGMLYGMIIGYGFSYIYNRLSDRARE